MKTSDSLTNLATALTKFQSEIEGAKKTSDNPFYKSKYADLGEIWKTIRGHLTSNGLSVIQTNKPGVTGEIILETMLLHTSGEYVISEGINLPLTKNDPQAAGSAETYARRYSLAAILGIHQEDDDANSHVVSPPTSTKKTTNAPNVSGVDFKQHKIQDTLNRFLKDKKAGFESPTIIKEWIKTNLDVDRISLCLDSDFLDNAITILDKLEANNG